MHTKKRGRLAYFLIAPFFLVFLVFNVYPIIYSLILSFSSWTGLSEIEWVGFANYTRLLSSEFFAASILNTVVIWIMSIVPQLTIAMILALILSEKWVKGRHLFRSVYYFPNLITPVTIGVLFSMLFSHPGGAVNNLLQSLNIVSEPVNWAYSPFLARFIIAIAICWRHFGYNIIFITAGLNSISREVYEAAEVDGANSFQQAIRITLPLLRPIMIFIMITSIIGGLQIFAIPMMFHDVPANVTKTMTLYMYETAFERWQFGYGSAVAYGNFMIIAVFSVISLIVTKKRGGAKDAEQNK